MDEDSEIIASNLEIFDQNDNKLFQDDDKTENNFVGIGEDPNLERNFITSSVKKIKKIDTEDELDAKGPPEVQYLCKVVQKLVLENYTPLKTSDFQDRESILNALNSLLLSISRDDSLLEWMENSSHFLGFAENFTDITNHPSSNYRATSSPKESLDSSLGILSNLSSFSSNEAILIDHSGAIDLNDSKPTYDYLGEIEDLQHKIKGLNEERTHLLQQMAQTEEINSNLFYENQDLQRNQQNLQGILEKMKEAEREYARLKLTVSNYEETNHTLQEKLTGHHRERLSLEARIRDLNDEITIVNQELDGLRNEFDELNEVLVQTRQELSCMKDANDILSHSLKEESEMLKENELKLSDLLESNNYLKNQKSELEERVCLLEEEIASLQNYTHRAQIIPENEINDPTFSCSCNNESSVLNCGNCSSTTINTKISGKTIEEEDIENEENQGPVTPIKSVNCVAASTPMRNEPILVKIPSLCAEMRDMLRSNGESLPTPFCGKHILPAALYRDRSIHGLDETDSPKMKIPKLEKNSRLAIEGSFDISSDSRPDFNLPRCTCGSLVQNVIFQENFLPMAKLEETPDFLNILQKNLQELASTLLTSINADTTTTTPNAPQSVAETNGIINEPPPSSNTQGGVDESLKDQINCELKVLRSQIAKTQAILSYLSRGQKLPAGIASLNSFIIEKDSKHRAKSDFSGSFNRLSGDLLAASESGHKKGLWVREHVRNPSYSPSQKSTPLHRSRWLTKSCPNLPSHWSVINRSTQTENSQMASETTFPRTPTSDLVPKTPTTPPRISPNEKPGSDEVDSPPTNREDILSITVSPLALRNRSLSYVTAIKKGNWDDASSNLLTVGQDVVIVHDKTPDFKSPPSEDDNKNIIDSSDTYGSSRKLTSLPEESVNTTSGEDARFKFIHHKNCVTRRLSRSFDETGNTAINTNADHPPETLLSLTSLTKKNTTGSARDLNRNYINSLSLPLVSFADPRLSRSVEATFTKLHLNRVQVVTSKPLVTSGPFESSRSRPPPYRHPPPASSKSAESLTTLMNATITKKQLLEERFATSQELVLNNKGSKGSSSARLEKQSSLPSSFCYPNSSGTGTTYRDRSNGEQYIIRTVDVHANTGGTNKSTTPGSRAILIPRSGLSRANHSHKDVVSSYDDDLNGYLNENRNTAKSDPELECEPQIELSSNLSEKAKKRRRSFSEHNSSYSGTIDLEEHEADLSRPEQMQGPFVTANSNGSPPLPMDKVTTAMPVSLSPPSQDVSLVKFPKASAAFTARVALSDKPKRLGRNPRFLMPDVMETSETESAKDSANGSMESETTEPITTTTTVLTTATTAVTITTVASAITTCSTVEVIKPPPPGLEPSFPSLPDDFLKKLNLEKGSLLNTEEMTSQEVESKFGTLSLAFKTDKFTLSKRLEIQKRQRDMAEGNIDKEVGAMREALNALNHMCTDSQMRDLIIKLQHQIDIVHQSTSRMSSRAEVYGAVQQEERMSHAYEIMVTYVENLKRLYQKEHHELEDTRRVLIENRLLPESNPTTGSGPGGSSDLFGSSSDDPKRPTRTSIASGSYKPQQQQTSARRRASVAVFHRPIIEAAKSCIGTLSNFGASASNGEFRARLYSAVTPSISPAKLERLTAVAVTSGAASCSTPSPPITPSSNNTANQRFPFPIAAPSTTGSGHLRKLAIGSSATGPLNSLTGNEELLAALDRVETVENAKTDSQKSESEEKSKESNNNEVYNEEPKEVELQVEHQRLVSNTKSSNKEETRDASANDASQQTTRSAFNPYPYYRQLSRILFRNDPIRPNHWLSNWLPDDGWWSHWNFNTVSRNVRFSVSFILIVGALLSIIVTFFPTQTTACGSSATYVSRSVQEFLADILRPYVTFRNNNPPV